MKKFIEIAGIVLTLCLAQIADSRATTIASFTDGNGTASVDQYLGVAGSGWATAWTAGGSGMAANVIDTSPLNGGGNYLSTVTTVGTATNTTAVRRQMSNFAEVDLSLPHTISFDFRPDFALGGTTIDNRYHLFGATAVGTNTSANNTWIALVAPGGNTSDTQVGFVANNWGFLNGVDGTTVAFGGAGGCTFVDSGLTMAVGTVYHFEIAVDPEARTYVGKISDGTNSFTSGTLSFRNQTGAPAPVAGSFLQFGARYTASATTSMGFSLDNVLIVPEPSAAVLIALGMLGTGAAVCRRRHLVCKCHAYNACQQ